MSGSSVQEGGECHVHLHRKPGCGLYHPSRRPILFYSGKVSFQDRLQLPPELVGLLRARCGNSSRVDAEGPQDSGHVESRTLPYEAQPEIPICRVPKPLVQSACFQCQLTRKNRSENGDEVLNEQAFRNETGTHELPRRKGATPPPHRFALRIDIPNRMNQQGRGSSIFKVSSNRSQSVRHPDVILVEQTNVLSRGHL